MKLEDIRGVGPSAAQKLKAAGITTPEQFRMLPDDRFEEVASYVNRSPETVLSMIDEVDKQLKEEAEPQSTQPEDVETAPGMIEEVAPAGTAAPTLDMSEPNTASEETEVDLDKLAAEEPAEPSDECEAWLAGPGMELIKKGFSDHTILYRAGMAAGLEDPNDWQRAAASMNNSLVDKIKILWAKV